MSDTRIAKLVDKLEKTKEHAKKLRLAGEEAAGRVVHSTLVVAGGAAVGAMRGMKMQYLPGTKVQTELAVGSALVAASVFGFAGKYSDHANSLGSGMLAVLAAETTQKMLSEHSAARR